MMKHGDFTGLAGDYAKFRAGYAPQVATAILSYVGRDAASIDAADIGAGTGIWTRTLAARGLHSVVAVEPNDDMRGQGIETSRGTDIVWHKGSAEATGLPDGSADLVSMASSFHWADFDKACDEFHRILRPGGVFVALWNRRFIEPNPLLVEIEAEITRLKPDIRRVSSGRSGITLRLTDMLTAAIRRGAVPLRQAFPTLNAGAVHRRVALSERSAGAIGSGTFPEVPGFHREAYYGSHGDRDNLI
jgi:SAM-dependent methyltransferase